MFLNLRKLFTALILLVSAIGARSAPPALHLSLNPAEYGYDLSITAVLSENCVELNDSANILIAQVNNQVRGYSKSSVSAGGKRLAFLTVYSNSPSGDTIRFRIYKASEDKMLDVKTMVVFQDDAVLGSPAAPFEMLTNNPPRSLALSKLYVPEHSLANEEVATITATDPDAGHTLSYSLVSGTNSRDNASFRIQADKLSFNGKINTLAQDTFRIRLRATDIQGCFTEKEFALLVDKVNDAPTGLYLSGTAFDENQPDAVIGLLSPEDQDLADTFSYAFATGEGDADNAFFLLRDSLLSFKGIANFEVKKTYSVRLKVTDRGGLYFEKVFTIAVNDKNDPPTGLRLSHAAVFENQGKNQFVARISSVDEDARDHYTYTFANIGTNDNTAFRIRGDTLRADLVFDFETKNSFFIYLTSTDSSGMEVTRPFTIAVRDTFDMPSDIRLSRDTITENMPAGSLVGVLSTIDANEPKPLKYLYSLVSGSGSGDNAHFSISGDSLLSSSSFNYEAKKEYSIRVKTELPNGMFTDRSFLILVRDDNETPSLITLSADTVAENQPDSSRVAQLTTTDEEPGGFRYALVSGDGGADNAAFAFRQNVLVLLKPADFEKKNTYNIRIRSTDTGGKFLEMPFVIRITDLNEKPSVRTEVFHAQESAAVHTMVGTVSVSDQDRDQSHTFRILTPGVPLTIDPATGDLSLIAPLDYETRKSWNFSVRVTDNGNPALSDSVSLTLSVLDEVEEGHLPSADLVTPNGDGKNDTWKITNVELYKDYSLRIVDEYSQLVYSADNNYDNDWDATYNGKYLPAGVYYYVFKSNTGNKVFKGYITVVK